MQVDYVEDLEFYLGKEKWLNKSSLYASCIDQVTVFKEVTSPKISVVVISNQFNRLVVENFKSLEMQRVNNFELIFVNNGKSDEEFFSILPYVDTYIKLNSNTGAYKARNIGALYAQASILLFLEDDGIPDKCLIESHLEAFDKYKVISVRGVYKPLTENKYNKWAKHYYKGNKPFPMYVNLEGNASYDSESFYSVGGWSDDITFGHGGPELSLRLTAIYPDRALQIYSPKPIIFHDFIRNEEHLIIKMNRQRESLERLKKKYPNWEEFIESWYGLSGKYYLLKHKNGLINLQNYLILLLKEHFLPVVERHLPFLRSLKKMVRAKQLAH